MAFINLNTLLPKSGDGQLVLYSGGPSSNGTNQNQDFENEGQAERVDYPGSSELPAASVVAMAQSVGVTISEDVATALGDIAMKKLRAATLLAVGFVDHENASGLRVSDFSKAEQIFNSPSYGHRSYLPEPRIIPIVSANISVLEEGPEIDLIATIASPQISEFRIRNQDPEFHVRYVVFNSRFATSNLNGEEEEDDECEESSLPELSLDMDAGEGESLTNNHHEPEIVNHLNDIVIQNGPSQALSPFVENCQEDNSSTEYKNANLPHQYLQLDQEWLEYMKLFVNCFLDRENYGEERDKNETANSEDIPTDDEDNLNEIQDKDNEHQFQCIVEDLSKYSAFPIVDVICDFFSDYLSGIFTEVSSRALHRIVLVVDALMCGWTTPPTILMRKLSSVLIEILVLPPGFDVQPALVHVFMKILKNYDELLTWACTYITEVLKRMSEMTAVDINDEYKCLLHGALLLANGLEFLDIKVAHEFGWDFSIEGIKRNHYQAKEEGSVNPVEADTFLEDEFNKFEQSNIGS